ncbi:MAG TPA: enterotoxin [Terriglobales bacterium]|nr:enterotoxin [Terriglobales bacterium]
MPNRRSFLQQTSAAMAAAWALDGLPGRALNAQTWLAHDAGEARARILGNQVTLGNSAIEATWTVGAAGLRLTAVRNPKRQLALSGAWPVCGLTLAAGAVDSSSWTVTAPPKIEALAPRPGAANFAERLPGRQLTVELSAPDHAFLVSWRGILRDGSHYIRQEVVLHAAGQPLPLTEVTMLDMAVPGAVVSGTVKGSPVTTPDGWFLGFEHPLSVSTVTDGRARCAMPRPLPVPAGQSIVYSSVIGASPAGQLRRAFLQYVERERAHPYRPFLHYNSWFDLGYFTPYDQDGCLDVIRTFGRELHVQRGVQLDSFLFDDGWDNHRNWQFNDGFPDGFTPLKAAAARIGAAPGIWLSPWGGYGKPRAERLAYAKANGYETNKDGLALSGPVYYRLFHQTCLEMIRRYGVNQFKLDGTGSTSEVIPGSQFGSDFEAAISLIGDLRAASPDLFINLTTGTYPSPFWLRYADSTWRGGSDTSFAGVGTDRQQWITYRDADTFKHVVGRGPLYPLNALMLHGIVFAKHAKRLDTDPGGDFTAEVRAYFGTGTQLQEMYISHDLLRAPQWDTLAEAALWARRQAATLVDTHWVGGDPGQLQPYGHAAWSERGAVLVLRNPGDHAQSLSLDPATAFELPGHAPQRYVLRSPWKRDQWGQPQTNAAVELRAGAAHEFSLKPFEVLTLESRA